MQIYWRVCGQCSIQTQLHQVHGHLIFLPFIVYFRRLDKTIGTQFQEGIRTSRSCQNEKLTGSGQNHKLEIYTEMPRR